MSRTECFGTRERVCRLAGLEVAETHHAPQATTPWHEHPGACIHVVLNGCYAESTRREEIAVGAGGVIVKPAGLIHRNAFGDERSRSLRLALDPQLDCFDETRELCRFEDRSAWSLAVRIQRELQSPDELSEDVVDAFVTALLSTVTATIHRSRVTEQSDCASLAARCKATVDELYAAPPSVDAIASSLGTSRSQLSRAFLRTYDMAVGEYIRRRRVSEAMRLLRNTDESISRIAARVGFCDQSHLTRVFARHVGATPARWRAQSRSA